MLATRRCRALPYAIAACWVANTLPDVRAQQPEALPERLRIEVTGSRIARIDGEGALPVQVIRRDEIERGNWTTAAELMSYVSANITLANNATTVGNTQTPGLSSADLRGIGDGNTLVLLNGRRLSNYAFLSGTVDLSAIPLTAIDRVEILKDGASSIYGTDAIAGVVNFITRKDFAGMSVTGQAALTEQGNGDHYQTTLTAGWGDLTRDKVNAFLTVDWQRNTALAAADRSFTANTFRQDEGIGTTAMSRATFPANIRRPNGALVNTTAAIGCQPPAAIAITGTAACWYDVSANNDLLPNQQLWNVLGRATWEWRPGQQLFAELVYSRNDLDSRTAPTAANRNQTFGVPVTYPSGGPHYPAEFAAANGLSGPLEVNFRMTPLGPRVTSVTTEAQRYVVGAQGTAAGWAYDGAYLHSINTADNTFNAGYLSTPGFLVAMGSGLINPFGASTEAGLALLQSVQVGGNVRSAKGTTDQVDLSASRDVYQLAAGPITVALGGEWRHERLSDEPSSILANGEVIGVLVDINPQEGSRTVGAAYAELNVPVAKSLEFGASVRYDNYSDFGGTTNPKVALRWQPVTSILVRGTWGTGFRAPSLPDLYTPVSSAFFTGFEDPLRCPVTGSPADCGQGEYLYVNGGNRDLQPETSTQYSAGLVLEPVPGISLGLEWWQIAKKNLIVYFVPFEIFSQYDVLGPGHVVRDPPDAANPTLPGPINAVIGTKENGGNLTTSGVDVTLSARVPTTSVGEFRFALSGTYISRFTVDETGGNPFEVVGRRLIPRWRHYAEIDWRRGSWSFSLAQLFQQGTQDSALNTRVTARSVGNYSLWNLQGVYSGFKDWSIAAGVRNLFDTDPPFSTQADTAQVGYNPTYGDPRGRSFYVRLSYAFK